MESNERVNKALKDIDKSIQSFQSILEAHRQPHYELLADHYALIDVLNDHINDKVETLETSESTDNGTVISKEINWEYYRNNQLGLIREIMMSQIEAQKKKEEPGN